MRMWTDEELDRFALDVVMDPSPEDLERAARKPEARRVYKHPNYASTLRLLNVLYFNTRADGLRAVVQTADNILRGAGIDNPAAGLAVLAASCFSKSYQHSLRCKLALIMRDIEFVTMGYLQAHTGTPVDRMDPSSVQVVVYGDNAGQRWIKAEGYVTGNKMSVFDIISVEDAFEYRAQALAAAVNHNRHSV